jgi:IS30 family transposase
MLSEGCTQGQIAQVIGKSQSAISRELARNGTPHRRYRPVLAHRRAVVRRQEALALRTAKMDRPQLLKVVQEGLGKYWSPQQIAGRLAHEQAWPLISHETIYKWIAAKKAQGQNWHMFLRQAHRKYRRRSRGSPDGRGKIPGRTFIEHRPSAVDERRRFGDWEGDTLVGGKHRGAVVTHVERKSQYVVMASLPVRDHRELVKVSGQAFSRHELHRPLPRKTETLDNGLEFWSHQQLGQTLGLTVYFARPHHPWERGLNEQVNGLIRQFLPKGSDLTNVGQADIQRIEDLLNNRPRKTLGYRTPIEVLRKYRIYASRI